MTAVHSRFSSVQLMGHRQDLKANTQDELMLECVTTFKWAYKILAAETWIWKRRVEIVKLMMAAWGQYILSTFLAKCNITSNWKRAALPSFFFLCHGWPTCSWLTLFQVLIITWTLGWCHQNIIRVLRLKGKRGESSLSFMSVFADWLPYLSKNCTIVFATLHFN